MYPIAELRMNTLKNTKLVAIPDHLIIRNATEVLNNFLNKKTNKENSKRSEHQINIGYERRDKSLQARIKYAASIQYRIS